MDLEEILTKVGLDEKEAKVYLALLDLGSEKVHEIAKKAGIKRPTAYVILEQLYAKNFAIKTHHNRRAFYAAEKPDILLRALKEKEDLLQQTLPLLQARMAASKIRPKIRIYEGRNGIEKVYDEIYESPAVCLFGSLKNLSEIFVGRADKLKEIIKSQNIHVRDLLTEDPKDLDFGYAALGRNYEGRVVPKEFDLYIDGAIYGDQVAILSIKKELFAVVIESKEVADTFQSLFELAWKMSVPLEQFQRKQ
ncbi:MAG TPA: helix-turn-helix domain-containing protein [Candidatus Paceibacterota bacterium]|nr:helix-turn-helix domain-containing protein [Candidatus Paceibacterota bacterium]